MNPERLLENYTWLKSVEFILSNKLHSDKHRNFIKFYNEQFAYKAIKYTDFTRIKYIKNRQNSFQVDNEKIIATVNHLYSSYQLHIFNMGENVDPEAFSKADILSLLQSILLNQQNSRPPTLSIIKIAEPGKFSGQRDIALLDAWFLTMERYLVHYKVDPVNWVSTSIHFLDGRAIIWWNRLYSLNKCPNDWTNFKELLNSEFKPLFVNQTTRDRFAVSKQGTSSVQDYVHAMQDILLEATDIAEPEAIDHFVRNLKPALFAKVRGARPASLDAAFKAAFDEEICFTYFSLFCSSLYFSKINQFSGKGILS